jgi:hypothetical protein
MYTPCNFHITAVSLKKAAQRTGPFHYNLHERHAMTDVSWTKRLALPVGLIMLPGLIIAFLFSEPRTFSNITEAFLLILTAPWQDAWFLVRSTGPFRRALLLLLFVALPVLFLPVYTVRPSKVTGIVTAIGAVLWVVSGLFMLVLRYID